jgi:hypothetical protein
MHALPALHSIASLTIRNLNKLIKAELRIQAARHGRSMEEEARTTEPAPAEFIAG